MATSRFVHASLALLLATVACALTPERLPELDRRFYYNLPTPSTQQDFLKQPASERQDYLERQGLWQRWVGLPESEREAAASGDVQVGFHEFALLMAWGPPADTQVRDVNDRPITQHTYIRCTSGPKAGRYVRNNLDCDGTSNETKVSIRNDIVSEIEYAR
ncbi:MAG: hypothetical protein JKY37_16200 [Nannocystaceae bacterium]|nr:hypothetical protein [Nannocystaceae bacterium]